MGLMSDPRMMRWLKLSQRRDETWQGGLVRLPTWFEPEGEKPYRPLAALWAAVKAGRIHLSSPMTDAEAGPETVLDTLLEFACDPSFEGYRPGRIEVTDAGLADFLREELAETEVEFSVVEHLDLHKVVLEGLNLHLNEDVPKISGPLEGTGVTIDRMRAFAEAAAAFYRAAPWRHLTDIDLIHIEAPEGPVELRSAVVLGMGDLMAGMAFYPTAKDYYEFRRMATQSGDPPGRMTSIWQVTFQPITAIPFADADLWMEHSLETADEQAYPVLLRFGPDMRLGRAGCAELTQVEAWLRALAATSEAEIDSGRWHKDVTTYDGPVRVTLAIHDLLKPPSAQVWAKRGFLPDPRSHERMLADMNRFLAHNPPTSEADFRATLGKHFTGRSFDDLSTPPSTPLEQAQDLCYQAFATFGRRRIQLARQALEISPDCADAWVILAEHSVTHEAQLECYSQGVAAGERSLGQEMFEEHRGHFWSVTETRPYMRARFGLARTLEKIGRLEDAVVHYLELLELNHRDNQGIRYVLLPCLLQLGRDADAARLLKQHDEATPQWAYYRALIAFRSSGPSAAAGRELRTALRRNSHVPRFLLSDEAPPLPSTYSPGSVEEAVICAHELKPAFAATEGAEDWLAEAMVQRDRELRRQQRKKLEAKRNRKKKKGR